jgi:chitinase
MYKDRTSCYPPSWSILDPTVTGMPMLKDHHDVPDPKDIVEQAMGNTANPAVAIDVRAMVIFL